MKRCFLTFIFSGKSRLSESRWAKAAFAGGITAIAFYITLSVRAAAYAQSEISLPGLFAIELPRGAGQIGPTDAPLRDLLKTASCGDRKITWDLMGKIGVGAVRVTFSAWDGMPGQGKPATTRTTRIFVLPAGTTPMGVSGDENATTGNNAVHIARDVDGLVHMVWQDSGRPGGKTGPVYRRAAVAANGTVHFETDPIYIADSGPSDWNAYPALAVSGRNLQLVWQGGGTVHTRQVSHGRDGWTMGPIIDTGAKSDGSDIGPAIAFDDKGGLHLATPSGVYAYSANGGRTWKTESIPIPANERMKTQSLAVDPLGTVHVAFSAPVSRKASAGTQYGYWQLRTIDRTPDGRWINAADALAGAPAWGEPRGTDEDILADWVRIVTDRQGGLHLAWHGSGFSKKYGHDEAFYAYRKRDATWSQPLMLVPQDPARGIKYSHAPSLTIDGDYALALTFYDINVGANWAGFDSRLAVLRNGHFAGPPIPVAQFTTAAVASHHPDAAMGSRFPEAAPSLWRTKDGRIWLDVLEVLQTPHDDTNFIVYRQVDVTSAIRQR